MTDYLLVCNRGLVIVAAANESDAVAQLHDLFKEPKEIRVYRATKQEVRLFRQAAKIQPAPKTAVPVQLDWINGE